MKGFSLILPSFSLVWHEAGTPAPPATIGDILLTHRDDFASSLIDEGQKALALTEPSLKPFTWTTHSAYVRSSKTLSEMDFDGYRRRPLTDLDPVDYFLVHFRFTDAQRASTHANDDAMSGVDYGWAQYLPLIVDGITAARFEGSWGSSIICSTHVTLALMGGGVFPDCPPSLVVPARIASWVGAIPPKSHHGTMRSSGD